jgi:hypothetical protein
LVILVMNISNGLFCLLPFKALPGKEVTTEPLNSRELVFYENLFSLYIVNVYFYSETASA